jgi:hypothetical protein
MELQRLELDLGVVAFYCQVAETEVGAETLPGKTPRCRLARFSRAMYFKNVVVELHVNVGDSGAEAKL